MCSCFISVWGLGSAVSFFKEENYLPLSLLVIWVFHREGNKPGVKWLPGSARGGGGGDWCLCFHWVWRGAGAQPASPLRFTGVGEHPRQPPSVLLSSVSPRNSHPRFPVFCLSPPPPLAISGEFFLTLQLAVPRQLPDPCASHQVTLPLTSSAHFSFSPCWDRVSHRLG